MEHSGIITNYDTSKFDAEAKTRMLNIYQLGSVRTTAVFDITTQQTTEHPCNFCEKEEGSVVLIDFGLVEKPNIEYATTTNIIYITLAIHLIGP